MGSNRTGGQRTATSQRHDDGRKLSRLRNHYRGSTALSNRALFWGAPLIGAALLSAVPAAGNPTGGSVVGGGASITGEGSANVTVNQTTDRAILHWDDFSIDAGETTQFIQPGSGSIALNRVTGTAESILLGTLTANGNVWLVNPNGVFAGAGSIIDVNGFLASTADILDTDFLDGDNRFSFDTPSANPDATIVNYGGISVGERGLAALVAPGVENDGVIVGRMAQVVLGGAPTFALDFSGDGLLSFEVGSQVATAPDGVTELVTNSGLIDAPGGMVLLTASTVDGVVDNVINMSGVIQAQSLTTANGQVVLAGGDHGAVRVSGTIDASGTGAGETGGTVKLLGESVALELDGLVDASGDAGGGTVLVGGNFQGNGPEQNAALSFVGADASIHADALTSGDGGTVIVWADESTQYYGTITATGGGEGGDGGFVEVSGKENLAFDGAVNLTASSGETGTLLLDPRDIIIAAGGTSPLPPLTIDFGDPGVPDDTTITGASVATALNTADVILQANRDILVNDIIDSTADADAGDLTFQAGRDIALTQSIAIEGAFIATANDPALTNIAERNVAGDVQPADFTMTGGTSVSALGGISIDVEDPAGDATRPAGDISLAILNTGIGDVIVASPSGSTVTLSGDISTNGGNVDFTGAPDVDLAAAVAIDTDATGDTVGQSAGSVLFAAAGNIDATAGVESLTIDATQDNTGTSSDGSVTLGVVGQFTPVASLSATGGSLTLGGAITTADGDVILSSGSALTIANAINTQPGLTATDSTIDLSIDPGSDPKDTSPPVLTISGAGSLNSDVVTLSADGVDINGPINATGVVTVQESTPGRGIEVGDELFPTSNEVVRLGQAELDNIETASVLRIGSLDAGNVAIVQGASGNNVTLGAGIDALALISGARVADSTLGGITVDRLRISAANVELNSGLNDVISELAAEVVDPGGDFLFTGEVLGASPVGTGLTIGSVDGVDGISTADSTTTSGTGSGGITLSSTGTITINEAITTGESTTDTQSGAIALTSDAGININQAITTGNHTVTSLAAADTAQSGTITVTATGAITGGTNGILTTGAAAVTDGGDGDSATSGNIVLDAGGAIALAAANATAGSTANALNIGDATVTAGVALEDTATVGSINVTSAERLAADGSTTPIDVSFGTASVGADAGNSGVLSVTTTGDAGGAGGIFVTSNEALSLGALDTADGTAQTIDVTVTDSSQLTVAGASTLDADDVTLTADVMDIGNSITTTGIVTLAENTAGLAIDLGTETSGSLSLEDSELDQITDASVLRIGSENAGAITITAAVSPGTNVVDVSLISGATVTDDAVAGSITANGLFVSAAGATLDSAGNNVTELAAQMVNGGDDFIFAGDADGITVAEVDGVSGIIASDDGANTGDVTLVTAAIGFDEAIAIADGTVDLTATGNITDNNVDVDIIAGSLVIDADGVGVGDPLETQVSNLAATVDTGGVDLDNTGDLTITTVARNLGGPNLSGVTSTGGAVDITAASSITVDQAVSAIGIDNVTLAATEDVTVNAGISTVTGTLNLIADSDSTAPLAGTDDLTINQALTTLGGTVDLDSANISSVSGGTITTTASADSGLASGNVDIDATGTITLGGDIVTTGAANAGSGATASAGGLVEIDTVDGAIAVATINTSGGEATDLLAGDGGGAGAIDLTAGGSGTLTLNSALTAVGGDGVTSNGLNGNVSLAAGGNIVDANTTGPDIVAGGLAIDAAGVGTGIDEDDALETAVATLEASVGSGGLDLDNTGVLTLGATGGLTGVTAIDNGAIDITATADVTVDEAVSATGSGSIALTAGTVGANNIEINGLVSGDTGDVSLVATTGTITQAAGTAITGAGLGAQANGNILLGESGNDVGTFAAASANGNVAYQDSNGFEVGAVSGITGVSALTTVQMQAGTGATDDITQAAGASISAVNLAASAGDDVVLDDAGNNVTTVAITAVGDVAYRDTATVDIGAVAGIGGLTPVTGLSGSNVQLQVGVGGLTQTEAITATGLAVRAAGNVLLNNTDNDVDTFAVSNSGSNVALLDVDEIDIGNVSDVGGLAALGGVTSGVVQLQAGNPASADAAHDITQTASVSATSLAARAGGDVVLDDSANTIGTVAADAGFGAELQEADGVTAGTVGAFGGLAALSGIRARDGSVSVTVVGDDAAFANTGAVTATTTVDLSADNMTLGNTVSGTTVTLASNSAGDQIDIGSTGSAASGTLELSNAELNQISATTLVIGDTDAGAISVSNAVNVAGAPTLSLQSTEGITTTGVGSLAVANLSIDVDESVSLTGANDVDVLAANVADSAAGFTFVDSDGFSVGSAGGLTGVTANAGAIALTANSGQLTNATNISSTGDISLRANDMDLGGGAIDGGAGMSARSVRLAAATANRIIDLGDDPDFVISSNALELTDADLDTISADVLRIGAADAGPIYFTDAITLDPVSVPILSLETNSAVLRWAVGDGDTVAVESLAIDANNFVLLDQENNVGTLAVETPSFLAFNDADGFTIGSVDSVSGLTSGSTMTLRSQGGTIAVAGNIAVQSGNTMLIDTGVDTSTGTDTGGSFTTGAGSSVVATSGDLTVIADNVGLGGTLMASAPGATATIANATAGRSIGLGGATEGLDLDLTELSRITADTVTIGADDAGSMVIAGLDDPSTDTFNTLELITGQDMQFDGSVDGSFNLTTMFSGDVNFNDSVNLVGTVRFETPTIGALSGNVFINNDPVGPPPNPFTFNASGVEIAIAGDIVNSQILFNTSTEFDGMNVATLDVERANSVTLFGSIAGFNDQTAASRGTATNPQGDWLFNGCVISTVQCFNVPIIIPISGLDLSLEDERLLREPFEEEEEESEDLLSNTGNEELW